MKLNKIYLRCYKSFNINYMGYDDRKSNIIKRPWNFVDSENIKKEYKYIEIPLEQRITTIIGANESGKSHLLSSIQKILLDQKSNRTLDFKKTDRCHYARKNQNTNLWPNIGIEIRCSVLELEKIKECLSKDKDSENNEDLAISESHNSQLDENEGILERKSVKSSKTKKKRTKKLNTENDQHVTLMLGGEEDHEKALIYIGEDIKELTSSELKEIRKLFPKVEFIHSQLSISNSIPILSLIRAYEDETKISISEWDTQYAQDVLDEISGLVIPDNPGNNAAVAYQSTINALKSIQKKSGDKKNNIEISINLEVLLFRDILGISLETLQFIQSLGSTERSYIESIVNSWNQTIEKELNLSRYWQQDEEFSLRVNYKRGIIYFEIKDKTDCIYTFNERSSGLRYFLSYYIQAKAIAKRCNKDNVVILMDEPDSFLSILGQKNLLSIFEDLTSIEMTNGKSQLIYTTHSPFLINKNYPKRIRLVRKGDAEEGTQYIPAIYSKRYEPIRTALGIDCAQTLFMGKTNLIVEGPSDQLLFSSLIQFFSEEDIVSNYLDLNSIILTSADSAPGVEHLIAKSQWGDEVNPAIVVLLDSDEAGITVRKRIIGEERHCKKIISQDFVVLISDVLDNYEENHKILTSEDLVSKSLYRKSILNYINKWYPDIDEDKILGIKEAINDNSYGINGLDQDTKEIFEEFIFSTKRVYDKFGVFQEVIDIINNPEKEDNSEIQSLKMRLQKVCSVLRNKIDISEDQVRKYFRI